MQGCGRGENAPCQVISQEVSLGGRGSVLGTRTLLSTPARSLGQSGKMWGGSISVLILSFTLAFNKLTLCATPL